ncbi:unnamed protein product, partial [Prorocentrum cordatum]
MERAQAALGEAAAALAAASGPSRGAAEQLHFGGVRALIEGQRWTATEKGQLLTQLGQTGFSHDLVGAATEWLCGGRTKAKGQSYECFVELLTASTWHVLLSPTESFASKFVMLMRHLERLGLRSPSEPTFGMLAAFMFLAYQRSGIEKNSPTPQLLDVYLQLAKTTWRSPAYAAARGKATEFVGAPPPSAALFQQERPTLCEKAFASEGPVQPTIGLLETQVLGELISLRGNRNAALGAQATPQRAALPPTAFAPLPPPSPMQSVAVAAATIAATPPLGAATPAALPLGVIPTHNSRGGWPNPAAAALVSQRGPTTPTPAAPAGEPAANIAGEPAAMSGAAPAAAASKLGDGAKVKASAVDVMVLSSSESEVDAKEAPQKKAK